MRFRLGFDALKAGKSLTFLLALMLCPRGAVAKSIQRVASEDLPQFDKLLLDVPCSGLGVMSKRADLRWRRTPQDLQNVVAAQVKTVWTPMQHCFGPQVGHQEGMKVLASSAEYFWCRLAFPGSC